MHPATVSGPIGLWVVSLAELPLHVNEVFLWMVRSRSPCVQNNLHHSFHANKTRAILFYSAIFFALILIFPLFASKRWQGASQRSPGRLRKRPIFLYLFVWSDSYVLSQRLVSALQESAQRRLFLTQLVKRTSLAWRWCRRREAEARRFLDDSHSPGVAGPHLVQGLCGPGW